MISTVLPGGKTEGHFLSKTKTSFRLRIPKKFVFDAYSTIGTIQHFFSNVMNFDELGSILTISFLMIRLYMSCNCFFFFKMFNTHARQQIARTAVIHPIWNLLMFKIYDIILFYINSIIYNRNDRLLSEEQHPIDQYILEYDNGLCDHRVS